VVRGGARQTGDTAQRGFVRRRGRLPGQRPPRSGNTSFCTSSPTKRLATGQ
jgi:hypothetical protein